ncbi:hypothetical protein DD563_02765 [Pelagicola sp. LXJ1103]|nr:hypothetical protein DD563_02765 [Pelagicola sp. LXJ1103]
MATIQKPENLPSGALGQVKLDPLESPTIPSRYYTDQKLYDQEIKHIHLKSWCYVGHICDVSETGMYFTDTIGGQPIVVVRGDDDVVRAFYNVCQHRGHELVQGAGRLKSKALVCPYHAWMFRLDGTLHSARMTQEVKGFDKARFSLKGINIAFAGGLIFVNLDKDCKPFDEEMAGFAENFEKFRPESKDFIVAERLNYDIKANWKLVYENFSEAYHIPIAHPQLSKVLEQEMEEFVTQDRWTFNRFKSKTGFPGFELEAGSPYYAWQAWPHFAALSLPGSCNLVVLRMSPDGIGRCAERVDIYTLPSETENSKLYAVRDLFMHMFNIEDIGIVESVQRGISSNGYDQGRYVCDEANSWFIEVQLHWFHMKILAALENVDGAVA